MPNDRDALIRECVEDVSTKLHKRAQAARPGKFAAGSGLPDLADSLTPLISGALDMVVIFAGVAVDRVFIEHKDAIRAIVSDRVLTFMDGLIHDLQQKSAT